MRLICLAALLFVAQNAFAINIESLQGKWNLTSHSATPFGEIKSKEGDYFEFKGALLKTNRHQRATSSQCSVKLSELICKLDSNRFEVFTILAQSNRNIVLLSELRNEHERISVHNTVYRLARTESGN